MANFKLQVTKLKSFVSLCRSKAIGTHLFVKVAYLDQETAKSSFRS